MHSDTFFASEKHIETLFYYAFLKKFGVRYYTGGAGKSHTCKSHILRKISGAFPNFPKIHLYLVKFKKRAIFNSQKFSIYPHPSFSNTNTGFVLQWECDDIIESPHIHVNETTGISGIIEYRDYEDNTDQGRRKYRI